MNRDGFGDTGALYRLLSWLSPSYPVGSFSYSSGLEWAVEAGDVVNADGLQHWLVDVITRGNGWCDAVLLACAHRAVMDGNDGTLFETAELGNALVSSKERHLETSAQGHAFLQITQAAWPSPALDRLRRVWRDAVVYPVAVGVVAAGHGVALEATVHAYLHAAAANLVSAGVRLIPLGQTDGQRVVAGLEAVVALTAGRATSAQLDDVGSCTLRADIAAMKHEMQYTRLFRS